jgi:hypothetical protein
MIITPETVIPAIDSTGNNTINEVIGNKSDTSAGTSLVGQLKLVDANVDAIKDKTDNLPANTGTELANIKAKTDLIGSGVESQGTYTYTDAGAEQTIKEVINTKRVDIKGIWLELNNMTQDGVIKFYTKINGTDYREIQEYRKAFGVADAVDYIFVTFNCFVNSDFKVTYTEDVDETADRDIYFNLIYKDMEV